jgi:hypothetical protein
MAEEARERTAAPAPLLEVEAEAPFEGEVRARLTVARGVDVSVEQRFRRAGPTTHLQVRIRI